MGVVNNDPALHPGADEIRSFHGPMLSLSSPLHETFELSVEVVKAKGATQFFDYHSGKRVGDGPKTSGWRFAGGIVYDIIRD